MISVEVSTPNSVSVDDVVNRVEVDITTTGTVGGGGGGGGDHGGLTGLLDDDHPQYQRADSVYTTTNPYTITDESFVLTSGTTVILPDAATNVGRQIFVAGASAAVTVTRSGTDTIHGYGTSFTVPYTTARAFVSLNIAGSWGWVVWDLNHNTLSNLNGDDHLLYEPTTNTLDTSGLITVTTETRVFMAAGGAVTLPDAATRPGGRTLTVLASGGAVSVTAVGGDNVNAPGQTVLEMTQGTVVRLAPIDLSVVSPGLWLWAVVDGYGSAFDLPAHYDPATGLPTVDQGNTLVMGATSPAWTTGTRTAEEYLSGTGWTYDVPVLVPVKNTSGGTIAKGIAVYATGTVGSTSTIEIAPADADDAAKMPSIGLTNSSLAVNATGYVTVVGTIRGVNTAGYSVNSPLYVSTTAGGLTSTKPTGTSELIQNIGRVTRVNSSTGEILVLGPGRTNDVPNAIDAGKITSGTVATARLSTKILGGQDEGSIVTATTATTLLDSTISVTGAAGDLIEVVAGYRFLNNSGTTKAPTITLKLGATTVVTYTPSAQSSSATDRQGHFRAAIRLESTTDQNVSALGFIASGMTVLTGTSTEDLGAGVALDLTGAVQSGGSQEIQLHFVSVKRVAA